jgi:hypothetical protein
MMRLSVASAVALAVCEARPIEEVREQFTNFKKDFNRGYEAVEHEARFLAFAANVEFIEAENAKGHSYKLGLTPFADMSNDEFVLSHMLPCFRPSSKPWSGLPYLGSHQAVNVTLADEVLLGFRHHRRAGGRLGDRKRRPDELQRAAAGGLRQERRERVPGRFYGRRLPVRAQHCHLH